jgi:putative chitinase
MALQPEIAAKILVKGMQEGWFTGKKLADYLPQHAANRLQFQQARRIINGTDKADLIAGYALQFQSALDAGGWR